MGVIRGSSFYEVVTSVSWEEAESLANSLGGNLAAINDESENIFILREFSAATQGSSRGGLWIGLSADLDGNFTWSNGDTYEYSNFTAGQGLISDYRPYIGNRSAVDGQYVHMLGSYSSQVGFIGESAGDWNDVPNNPTSDIAWGAQYEINKGIAEVPLSYFSVSDLTIEEGEKGKVTISRTGGTQSSQTLTLSTSNGSAVVGDDYGRKNKTLTFAAGETSKTVNIVSKEDDIVEGNETFTLTLSASGADAVPAQVSDGVATVTITDDDVVLPSYYSIGDVQGYEGDTLYALVNRTGNINIAHSLSLSASNGTAFSGFDFVAPSSTVSFAAGESSKLVGIRSIEDSLVESDEAFTLSLSAISSGAEISDGSATLTILNDDSNTTTNFYQSYTYNVDNSTNYKVDVGNVNSKGGSVVIGGSGNTVGNSSTTTTVNVDYKFIGGASADVLKGYSGDNFGADLLDGGDGDDDLTGYRGADFLNGGAGNDILRAGNGRDILTGGDGADVFYGGFGLNTFEDEADGQIDQLYFRSDQWAENWLYGSAGNSPNGEKADKIEKLDAFDQIYVQGVETSQLSYGAVSHNSNLGETLSGIGIYASGVLEAVYVGDNLSLGQIAAMTQGVV